MDIDSFVENVVGQFDEAPVEPFTPETKFHEVEGWSSLVALSLIAMADEEYGVTLKGDDIRNAVTIQDLYNAVVAKKA